MSFYASVTCLAAILFDVVGNLIISNTIDAPQACAKYCFVASIGSCIACFGILISSTCSAVDEATRKFDLEKDVDKSSDDDVDDYPEEDKKGDYPDYIGNSEPMEAYKPNSATGPTGPISPPSKTSSVTYNFSNGDNVMLVFSSQDRTLTRESMDRITDLAKHLHMGDDEEEVTEEDFEEQDIIDEDDETPVVIVDSD